MLSSSKKKNKTQKFFVNSVRFVLLLLLPINHGAIKTTRPFLLSSDAPHPFYFSTGNLTSLALLYFSTQKLRLSVLLYWIYCTVLLVLHAACAKLSIPKQLWRQNAFRLCNTNEITSRHFRTPSKSSWIKKIGSVQKFAAIAHYLFNFTQWFHHEFRNMYIPNTEITFSAGRLCLAATSISSKPQKLFCKSWFEFETQTFLYALIGTVRCFKNERLYCCRWKLCKTWINY